MEKVLLAIDGMRPDQQIVDYAAKLCRRIKAELSIVHIIDPEVYAGCLKNFHRQVHRARDLFENTMIAATFAESGDHDSAKSLMDKASAQINQMLSDTDKNAIKYRIEVQPGETGQEIVKYVNKHRDVVVAIYDGSGFSTPPDTADGKEGAADADPSPGLGGKPRFKVSELQKKLAVPLVVRRFATNGQQ
ncbi:MAG: universal stress protein [Desulfobacterales bacterium]|nr:universal stress protein [Desulfobacterales bacterium]